MGLEKTSIDLGSTGSRIQANHQRTAAAENNDEHYVQKYHKFDICLGTHESFDLDGDEIVVVAAEAD